jgi:O-antigen ligase
MSARERTRILSAFFVCILLSPALLVVPGVKNLVAEKMETMVYPRQDVSYQARIEGYQNAFATLAHEPFGEGVGSPDIDHATKENDDAIGPHDSLILELLYSLGWCGTAFYLAGLGLVIWRAFAHPATNHPFEDSMKAVLVAFFAQCLLNDIVYGGVGFFFWSAGAMQLAAITHAESELRAESAPSLSADESAPPFATHEEGDL